MRWSDYRPTKKQTRLFFYDALCKMYGERCYICKKSPPEVQLIVEHRNGNKGDYSFDNIYLGCRSCNRKKSPDLCLESAADSGKSVCETGKAAESTTDSEKYRERSRIKNSASAKRIPTSILTQIGRYVMNLNIKLLRLPVLYKNPSGSSPSPSPAVELCSLHSDRESYSLPA